MRLISSILEKEMQSAELNRNNVKKARQILENGLCEQFQLLTLSLYSNDLLCGKDLTSKELSTIKDLISRLFPETVFSSEEDIIQFVADGIYNKRWPTVDLKDLLDIEIRLYGKYVYLWDTIEINEQLALLGSNYRFYFAGSIQLAHSYIENMIGYNNEIDDFDCRYIFGEIGNISISLGGQVFDFITEIATSPYLVSNVPGFSIGDTSVIRRNILKECNCNNSTSHLQVYLHEILHTIEYSFKYGAPFTVSNWDIYLKRDICRYLINPHSKDEIDRAFEIVINPILLNWLEQSADISVFKKLTSFSDIFSKLIDSGVLIKDDAGYYICTTYQEGQAWDVF